ncbi:FtsX-like permease family protein [Microbacterium sp. zg.Y625]|uniref:FtsX-like permease family protein n=1 Tax=Microbacterium jiangjiandongii TaxID=3049071 RepID=UPI00214C2E7F|nr:MULTISPECIES: FtsX-like permease family protein [unclassified Microbacterium]MCR2792166.1 FtsX-like permease family protein [Microbacterium sp. zg.Y625]WIM24970.1 FtsX-like permease family protein [Microbacterium sp. zg-Y625]
MTVTAPAPDLAEPPSAEPAERPPTERRSPWPRLRADLRLASRQVRRAWASSLLVVALIALPMALVSGGIVFAVSHVPTTEETLTAELGQADSWVAIVNGPDPSLRQYLDEPTWWELDRDDMTGIPANAEQPMPESAAPLLPAGLDPIEIGFGAVTAETAGGTGSLAAVIGDAWDPVLDGRFELHDGRAPRGSGEAMVSPGALQRLGARVGDDLVLTEPAASFTITGVMTQAEDPDAAELVFLPATASLRALQVDVTSTRWFLPEWSPTADDVAELNSEGLVVLDRHLYANPGAGAAPGSSAASVWSIVAIVAAAAAFSGYLVVLLAGAAFSVSARRQQRALAVAASVGAGRGDVFRIVLLQGTVLGLVGGVIGSGLGIGLGILFLHLLDDGSAAAFWGLHVPWPALVGVVAFAAIVGTLAALMPARAATRGEVIAALRGARRPVRVRTDRPLWGSLLLAAGVGLTAVSGTVLATVDPVVADGTPHPLWVAGTIGIIAGPLLLQVGVILAGHWLLTLLTRVLSPLGIASRIASRDAAANPGRIVPAFAAIAAVAFLSSAALGGVGVSLGSTERGWVHQGPLGSVAMTAYPSESGGDPGPLLEEAHERGRALLERSGPSAVGSVWSQGWPGEYDERGRLKPTDGTLVSPLLQDYVACSDADPDPNCVFPSRAAVGYHHALGVVAASDLEAVLGVPVPDSVRSAFGSGAAIVSDPRFVSPDGRVVLNTVTLEQVESDSSDRWNPDAGDGHEVDVAAIDLPQALPWGVVISPQTADDIGVLRGGLTLVAAYPQPPSVTQLDRLRADAESSSRAHPDVYMYPHLESGPPAPAGWLWLILGATAVLVVAASAVALGLARVERRPDDATLAAVGGSRRLRRGIAFWQALVIAGMGAMTGAVAGILPVWGLVLASGNNYNPPQLTDLPWVWLTLLAVGLPLAIALASWLVPPRHPDLTRRTAIA